MIRKMVLADLPRVSEIEAQSMDELWGKKELRESMETNNAFRGLVYTEGEEIYGFIVCFVARFCAADIAILAVDPAMRRHGIGRQLIQAATQYAAEEGIDSFYLEVRMDNEPAIALYESEGFKFIAYRLKYYRNGEHAGLMRYSRRIELDD